MTETFQRFTAADADALARDIEQARGALAAARTGGVAVDVIERAGELAGMLTTARREAEAHELLDPLRASARAHAAHEPAGWYYLALGTASQYLDRRAEANTLFAEALRLARLHGWQTLEHFVLSHWGRSLAEEHDFARARDCFEQALVIRERLGEPRVATTRRALDVLREWEARHR